MDRSFGGTGMDWTCVNTRKELELWERWKGAGGHGSTEANESGHGVY
ncbi:hypothetical protein [Paenibacillus apis]|nr:hypothetical protein [Paenibacillus apis]